MIDFPKAFTDRIRQQLGEEYDAFIKSYEKPFHNGLRVNSMKLDADRLMTLMGTELRPVPWNSDGFYLESKKTFSKHPFYHAGLYYIQEASAMLPAYLADVKPGERVLDLCAAPGGKSTAVGAALRGQGVLVSNDVSRSRAKALLRNLENFGISNALVTSEYPQKLADYFPCFFDKILIDAPCSGEGMFHKEPSMTENWQQMGPEAYHKLQKEILESAVRMLAPGGRLIYSTCTFSPQEDEGSVAWLLENFPDFHVVRADRVEALCEAGLIDHGHPEWADGNEELAMTLRLWPHHLDGEGHFAAILEKSSEAPFEPGRAAYRPPRIPKETRKLFDDFMQKEKIRYPMDETRLTVMGGYVQYLPEGLPDTKGLHVLRSGLFLGELKKNRFEPSGAFARALDPACCGKVLDLPAEDERVIRYLKCETLEITEDLPAGWYLVCVCGFPLGWGKLSGSTLKNKYPSGWRLV